MWSCQSIQENGNGNFKKQGNSCFSNNSTSKVKKKSSRLSIILCLICGLKYCLIQKVSMWKKIYVIYSFFFVRKIVAHVVTFIFYCVVLPATVLVPEVEVPKWAAVYIPSTITLLNAVGTPSFHFFISRMKFLLLLFSIALC